MFTIIIFDIIRKTRRDAKVVIADQYIDLAKYKDHECLKTRTIHVQGVLPTDQTGMAIEQHLNDILKKRAVNTGNSTTFGQVQTVLLIPDYTKILEVELEIKDLKDLHVLMSMPEH